MEQTKKLNALLNYKNKNVIENFCNSINIDESEAELIFRELMRWLWLSNECPDDKISYIDSPLLIIDEMWHSFILCTVDYVDFCVKYFGQYIHHKPTSSTEKNKQLERSASERKLKKEGDLEKIYSKIEKDAFILWYYHFPEKYSKSKISELKYQASLS